MDNPITIPVLLDLTQAASVTSYGIFSLSRFEGSSITDTLLEAAAELFSNHYGIWGQGAASKVGPFAKAGWRVKISAARLRAEYLPQSENAQNVYVKAMMGETLVGHAFATRWEYEGRTVCWITQLVVATPHRSKGNATQVMLTWYHPMISCQHSCSCYSRSATVAILILVVVSYLHTPSQSRRPLELSVLV